jgi:hypothetical protein
MKDGRASRYSAKIISKTIIVAACISSTLQFTHASSHVITAEDRNRYCYGDSIDFLIAKKDDAKSTIEAKVPTRYYANWPWYSLIKHVPAWSIRPAEEKPICHSEPIVVENLFVMLVERENDGPGTSYGANSHDVNRAGTSLEKFPHRSIDIVEITNGTWSFTGGNRHYSEKDKPRLRERIAMQEAELGVVKSKDGFRALLDSYFIFADEDLTEPLSGLPMIYNCQLYSGADDICEVTYTLPGDIGLYYTFNKDVLPESRWRELDQSMRKFVLDLLPTKK